MELYDEDRIRWEVTRYLETGEQPVKPEFLTLSATREEIRDAAIQGIIYCRVSIARRDATKEFDMGKGSER